MKVKSGTFEGMAKDITSNNNKIVVFGTGVIGSTITPEILSTYDIDSLVECCIDNDKTRWNTDIRIGGRTVKIYSPDILDALSDNITVLITMSRCFSAYEQLKSMKSTKNMSCYFIPAMCIKNFHSEGSQGVQKTSDRQLIPKILHYMWLGGKPLPDNLKRCIDSWKKYCPDYEIVRWDESNYDIHKNIFMSEAYDNGRYGFVPDYARLDILHQYGGIYMDTDVELIRGLDDLLYQEAFCSVEKWQVINFGGCTGAVKGHSALEPFLEGWNSRKLIRNDGTFDIISSGLIDTNIALREGYQLSGKNQSVLGMNIYTYDYFHPYDYMSGLLEKTNDTFAIHHFQGGWIDEKAMGNNYKSIRLYKELLDVAEDVG